VFQYLGTPKNMNYHYLDNNNQPSGPVSLDEIRALARDGKIPADPKVAPPGAAEWRPLSSLPPTPPSAPPPPPATGGSRVSMPAGTVLGDFVGTLLKHVAGWLSPAFLEGSLAFARKIGQYAVLLGAVLTVVYAIVAAIRYNSLEMLLTGLVFVAAIAVAQFAAGRFLGAGEKLIASTVSRLSSPAFLECTGLLVLLLAAATFLGGIITSIRVSSVAPFLPALITSAALVYFGALALHPEQVTVETAAGTAGEEAIGLLCFFFKASLKLVPLFFFLLAVAGDLAILASFFSGEGQFGYMVAALVASVPFLGSAPYGFAGSAMLVAACLLPLLAYFVFLLQYLFLDVLRAILAVPGKLDALRR